MLLPESEMSEYTDQYSRFRLVIILFYAPHFSQSIACDSSERYPFISLHSFPGGKFLISFLTKYCIFLFCFILTTCLALRNYYDFKIRALLGDLNS